MRTLEELLRYGKAVLREAEIQDSDVDAWLLMESVFGISRTWYFAHGRDAASPEKEQIYEEFLEKRAGHIPLQHLTGQAFFYGREFYVDGRVLVPRQDTEILVEEAGRHLKPGMRLLDLCTGSGCILLSLLLEREGCRGIGTDLSGDALEVARINRGRLGLEPERAMLLQSDLFQELQQERGGFDMIVSNPPYIPTGEISGLSLEVRDHDPRMALDGREDGLWFYQEITGQAGEYLKPGGFLFYEIGWNQGEDVLRYLRDAGFENLRIVKDLSGLDRVAAGQWNKKS